MQQGDQYSIRITIRKEETALAPEDVEGVKVKIGNIEHRYPDGSLTYDTTTEAWLFPVTQEQTLSLLGTQPAQVQVNLGGTPPQIIGSSVQSATINGSVIRSVWNE